MPSQRWLILTPELQAAPEQSAHGSLVGVCPVALQGSANKGGGGVTQKELPHHSQVEAWLSQQLMGVLHAGGPEECFVGDPEGQGG